MTTTMQIRIAPPEVITLQHIKNMLDGLQWAYDYGLTSLFDDFLMWLVHRDLFPHLIQERWQIEYIDVLPYLDIATILRRLELANQNISLAREWNAAELRYEIGREIAKHMRWLKENAFGIRYDQKTRQYTHESGPLVAKKGKKQ